VCALPCSELKRLIPELIFTEASPRRRTREHVCVRGIIPERRNHAVMSHDADAYEFRFGWIRSSFSSSAGISDWFRISFKGIVTQTVNSVIISFKLDVLEDILSDKFTFRLELCENYQSSTVVENLLKLWAKYELFSIITSWLFWIFSFSNHYSAQHVTQVSEAQQRIFNYLNSRLRWVFYLKICFRQSTDPHRYVSIWTCDWVIYGPRVYLDGLFEKLSCYFIK